MVHESRWPLVASPECPESRWWSGAAVFGGFLRGSRQRRWIQRGSCTARAWATVREPEGRGAAGPVVARPLPSAPCPLPPARLSRPSPSGPPGSGVCGKQGGHGWQGSFLLLPVLCPPCFGAGGSGVEPQGGGGAVGVPEPRLDEDSSPGTLAVSVLRAGPTRHGGRRAGKPAGHPLTP